MQWIDGQGNPLNNFPGVSAPAYIVIDSLNTVVTWIRALSRIPFDVVVDMRNDKGAEKGQTSLLVIGQSSGAMPWKQTHLPPSATATAAIFTLARLI
jgi:hypothetical protein